jgi:hypothetical protein
MIYEIILPVVLYVCETWTLTLREDHKLQVFGNRVANKMFRPEREEFRKSHNLELHDV